MFGYCQKYTTQLPGSHLSLFWFYTHCKNSFCKCRFPYPHLFWFLIWLLNELVTQNLCVQNIIIHKSPEQMYICLLYMQSVYIALEQNILISNKWFHLEIYIHQGNLKENVWHFPKKYQTEQGFLNNFHDHVTLRIGVMFAENSALI